MLPLDAFRESITTVAGRDLAWLEWGRARPGAPAVCLHGAMGLSHIWDRFAAALGGRRWVVVPDLRGHGDSAPVQPAAYALQDYRSDVEALLAQLKIGRYALVGHSVGGLLALMLAGANPAAVSRLVVVDIEARPPAQQAEQLRAIGARGHRTLVDFDALTAATRTLMPGATEETVAWLLPYLYRRVGGGHVPKWDPETLAGVESWNVEPWLARIRCPVLLVRGEDSTVMRAEAAQAMAGQLDEGRLVTIPGAAHQVMLQQPEAFAEAVLPFLAEGDPPAEPA